jgi:hypothetical protein
MMPKLTREETNYVPKVIGIYKTTFLSLVSFLLKDRKGNLEKVEYKVIEFLNLSRFID